MRAEVADKLAELPDGPGVYLLQGAKGRVLYVGKAKSLKRRVTSYFHARASHAPRTQRLVEEVRDVSWLVTANEVEALILENSLIKKNKPRYNVNLRDDKNYPYIRITTSGEWPRMDIVRRPSRDGDAYFGPWVPASTARRTLRLLGQHFGIRACKGEIDDKDHRACLYWHVDQCLAPCAQLCSKEEYDAAVRDALLFLKGDDQALRERVRERMQAASERQAYERAAHHRDLLRMLQRSREGQRVASTGLEEQDAWGLHRDGGRAFLVVSLIRDGLVRGRREFALRDLEEITDEELLGDAVRQYYHGAGVVPAEILLPGEIDQARLTDTWLRGQAGRAVRVTVPRRGPRADRVAWATQNARVGFELRFARGDDARLALEELADVLELPEPPERIDCFDVSNIQAAEIVATVVVFTEGQPDRAQYRKFRIRGVSGKPDDFASLREAVERRLRRLVDEGRSLPDLVVVDGGAGQLSAASAALEAAGLERLALVALAKREELVFRRGELEPLRLARTSPALQLLQRARDEAHRTAVSFHRQRRRARTVTSALDAVPGIGVKRRQALLRTFGSVDGVRRASLESLTRVVGQRAARNVVLHLGAPTPSRPQEGS